MIYSFPPVADQNTRILVVGSMPGEASLRAQEYYAYKHNQFWKIVFDVFAAARTPKDYADKLHTLLQNRIGLWDALAACEREGSLDGSISRPVPNDFPALLKKYPHIHTLLFNGQAARNHFKRAFGDLGKTCLTLPSTSPAHASRTYLEKRTLWQDAFRRAMTAKR